MKKIIDDLKSTNKLIIISIFFSMIKILYDVNILDLFLFLFAINKTLMSRILRLNRKNAN